MNKKSIPLDIFIEKALYDPNKGYYTKKFPFGRKGDFITAPTISNIFSEIIAIWIISTWERLGKPDKFNFVELGPGDGSLTKVLLRTFKKFPVFYESTNIYLYEKSNFLKKFQKKEIKDKKVKWIKDFNKLIGPVIFFGNEFFDAIPIKQFIKKGKKYFEKYYTVERDKILYETFEKAKLSDINKIETFKVFNKKEFIEYPKLGFLELDRITNIINENSGGILLIDYGYLNFKNKNTLQAVMDNKKVSVRDLSKKFGKVDITYLVNFNLLKEYFLKNNLKVKNIVSQKFFLEKMGIIERAKILEKRMNDKQKDYMNLTLFRLLHKELMGDLFKVIFAYKNKNKNFLGFD